MENIEIKKVTLNDLSQLQNIGRQTFYETFSAGNTEENMAKYLEDVFSAGRRRATNPFVSHEYLTSNEILK